MTCFLLLHTDIEGKYGMWLDYWRGGGVERGTKDMLASSSKIIGGGLAPLVPTHMYYCISTGT